MLFSELLHGTQIIFIAYAYSERSIYILLSQTSLSPIFQSYFFQVPNIQPNYTTVYTMNRDPYFCHLSLQTKSTQSVLKVLLIGRLSFTYLLQVRP